MGASLLALAKSIYYQGNSVVNNSFNGVNSEKN